MSRNNRTCKTCRDTKSLKDFPTPTGKVCTACHTGLRHNPVSGRFVTLRSTKRKPGATALAEGRAR